MSRFQWLWFAPACALMGCFELPIPNIDTGDVETDTDEPVDDLCAPQDPSGTVAEESQVNDAYPSAEGGTLQDGVYDLVQFDVYSPATADDNKRQRRFVVSGNTIVSIHTDPGSPPEILGGTFTTEGTDLKFSLSCPDAVEVSMPYTATADELWIFDSSEPNLQVYERQ